MLLKSNCTLVKTIVETGKGHISKKVITEDFLAEMTLKKQDIIVERREINKYIDGDMPGMRLEGDITIIPVIKEVMIKRLMLVEEIYITKRQTEERVPVNEVLTQRRSYYHPIRGPCYGRRAVKVQFINFLNQ